MNPFLSLGKLISILPYYHTFSLKSTENSQLSGQFKTELFEFDIWYQIIKIR